MQIPLIDSVIHALITRTQRYFELQQLQQQIRRERRALSQLDDQQLLDIGVARDAALREANRPARDIPEHRVPPVAKTQLWGTTNPLLSIRLG